MEPLQPGDPGQVGGYRLVGRLGAGGMGQVYLGRSAAGRQVTVKLVRPELAGDPRFRARFAREVHAAQRVGGFHTAQVVAADPDAEIPWMVSAYIPGSSLREVITEGGPLPLEEVRALGAGLAEGLAAIHACGLVHRDLKPGNVIMAADGPRIIDFGVALSAEATSLTQAGDVVGTYAFMSPEQVFGTPVGPAGDVFSLGCVLAFAATGHSPFAGPTVAAIIHRITTAEPDLTGLPEKHDLHRLVTTCLAKDPADRTTAAEILTQLTRSDDIIDEPTETPSPADAFDEPTHTPVADHPGPAAPNKAPHWLTAETHVADHGHADATARTPKPHQHWRPEENAHANTSIRRRLILIAGAGAVVVAADAAITSLVSGHTGHPSYIVLGDSSEPLNNPIKVTSLAFSPDGKILADGRSEGAVELWDARTSSDSEIPDDSLDHAGSTSFGANSVAFSPNGRTLAGGCTDWKIALWYVDSLFFSTGKEITTLEGHADNVLSVAFSPGGTFLASGSVDQTVRLWDLPERAHIATLKGHTAAVNSVAFSPDGKTLASGSDDGTVRLWDVDKRAHVATLKGHTAGISSTTFSPDGKTLATSGSDETVRLWNLATRGNAGILPHPDTVNTVAFSPNGKTLASGSGDTMVRLWDMAKRTVAATLTGHTGAVRSVAFRPKAKRLGTASDDGTVRLWKIH
jgi:serine/threonine protein kinase